MMWDDVKSCGLSKWQVNQGFGFEQLLEATYVISVVGGVVVGGVLVMQALPYIFELFYDVR